MWSICGSCYAAAPKLIATDGYFSMSARVAPLVEIG
jgi:7-keto-8-aminopelargonate synthetase-like enzyme